jgi:hypothetical protein
MKASSPRGLTLNDLRYIELLHPLHRDVLNVLMSCTFRVVLFLLPHRTSSYNVMDVPVDPNKQVVLIETPAFFMSSPATPNNNESAGYLPSIPSNDDGSSRSPARGDSDILPGAVFRGLTAENVAAHGSSPTAHGAYSGSGVSTPTAGDDAAKRAAYLDRLGQVNKDSESKMKQLKQMRAEAQHRSAPNSPSGAGVVATENPVGEA